MVSTRRSRSTVQQKNQTYKEGDQIEVLRSDGIDIGTLVRKLDGGGNLSESPRTSLAAKAATAHWIVAIHAKSGSQLLGRHEDISERMLGRILAGAEKSDNTTASTLAQSSDSSTVSAAGVLTPTASASAARIAPTQSALEKARRKRTAIKAAAARWAKNKKPGPKAAPAKRGPPKNARKTAVNGGNTLARATRSSAKSMELFKGIEHMPALPPKKKKRAADDGSVVKVKMLTGTLFLYRGTDGQRRRAEFIWSK